MLINLKINEIDNQQEPTVKKKKERNFKTKIIQSCPEVFMATRWLRWASPHVACLQALDSFPGGSAAERSGGVLGDLFIQPPNCIDGGTEAQGDLDNRKNTDIS